MRRMCSMPCPGFGSGRTNETAGKLDAVGWGLFFLWVGTAFLLDVGWGIGLLGVGVLTLALQLVRRGFGVEVEGFWLLVGGALTLVAVWELAAVQLALGPIVLIAFGMMVLVWALRR